MSRGRVRVGRLSLAILNLMFLGHESFQDKGLEKQDAPAWLSCTACFFDMAHPRVRVTVQGKSGTPQLGYPEPRVPWT